MRRFLIRQTGVTRSLGKYICGADPRAHVDANG